MAQERENLPAAGLGALQMQSYSIDGNDFRAYYDAAGKLVFVIDDTVTGDKQNALLVINPVGDRKWDDILANDYSVQLEAVRPKKDNKYQKLDIEYAGLGEYDDLISAFVAGDDMTAQLRALDAFRVTAAVRAATARRAAAWAAAENARDTIAKTNVTIAELTGKLKSLKAKLGQQKKNVGREPTKQSAAKILRTESQIDATQEKLRRARKRLANAQRRLLAAEEDAEAAQVILDAHQGVAVVPSRDVMPAVVNSGKTDIVAAMPVFHDVDIDATDDVSDDDDWDMDFDGDDDEMTALPVPEKTNLLPEPKAEKMADEEVKPLFNKDPDILDEEIAFKPIDFGTISVPQSTGVADVAGVALDDNLETPAPLSFTPPSSAPHTDFVIEEPVAAPAPQPSSVLDTITSVEAPATAPVAAAPAAQNLNVTPIAPAAEPVRPAPISANVPSGTAAPLVRPVSPVSGAPVRPFGGGADSGARRPNFLYYLMLVALIVLSIFTLWLYQKSTNDNVPDLSPATVAPVAEEETPRADTPSPFIEEVTETVSVQEETPIVQEQVAAPVQVVEPEPEPEPEPVAPVVDDTVPSVPVTAEPEPEPVPEGPFLSDAEAEAEPKPVVPQVVNKPAYNAGSRDENMFVADAEYETETVKEVSAPAPVEEAPQSSPSDAVVCEDGMAPDENGCCGGETFTDLGSEYACCSDLTGECYDPLF